MDKINWTELNPVERVRVYTFPTHTISVYKVCRIEVRPSGKHRLETTDGRKLFISPNWDALDIDVDEWTC